jgi:hypothetical protein
MVKTTVYFPEALKLRLEQIARTQGRSEAEIVRTAVEQFTARQGRPRPKLPLFSSGDPGLAERVEELLEEGFGRD